MRKKNILRVCARALIASRVAKFVLKITQHVPETHKGLVCIVHFNLIKYHIWKLSVSQKY